MSEHFTVIPCVFISLRQGPQVLLGLRQNTGYGDGCFSLVSGHVEAGETIVEAAIREAQEEAGIIIRPENLIFKTVLYLLGSETHVDFFFECHQWEGEAINMEPHKCEKLAFYPLNQLPENTLPFVVEAFQCIEHNIPFMQISIDD